MSLEADIADIMWDPAAVKELAAGENVAVLEHFTTGILGLAAARELWGSDPDIGIDDATLFERVGDLMEQALRARANIRRRYKVSLL